MVKMWATAVLVLAATLTACSSGAGGGAAGTSTEPPDTVASTLPTGEHTEILEAVYADAMGSRDATFSATYDFYAPGLVGGDAGTLTLSQDLPRQASRFVADGAATGVAFVGADPDISACGMTGGQWHCYSAQGYFGQAPAVLDYGDLLGVFDTFRANQRWFAWTADTRDVAGQSARCAVGDALAPDAMTPELQRRVGTQATLCVAASGVPLLVELSRVDGTETIFRARATSYSTKVGAAAFDPPAQVESGPPNVTIPVPRPPDAGGGQGQGN